MPKLSKKNSGVQNSVVKIQPETDETGGVGLSAGTSLIQKCKVIGASKDAIVKVGDTIIVSDWLVERIEINGTMNYYVPSSAVLEIL